MYEEFLKVVSNEYSLIVIKIFTAEEESINFTGSRKVIKLRQYGSCDIEKNCSVSVV